MRNIIISAVLVALMVFPSSLQANDLSVEKTQSTQPSTPETQPPALPQLTPAPKQESTANPTQVPVPMLCGDFKSVTEKLASWKFEDIMISTDAINNGATFIMFHFNPKDKQLAISIWQNDMSQGCIAFIGNNVHFNRKSMRNIDPSI